MIGVFDSGFGGLTVHRALTEALPARDFVYLGDNRNAPYGAKPPIDVLNLTCAALEHLFAEGCTLAIVACNTASVVALRWIQQQWLPARRHDARRMTGKARRHRRPAWRLGARDAKRAADGCQNEIARCHARGSAAPASRPLLPGRARPARSADRFHWAWKVAPWGAGKSRCRVQPEASGNREKRPRPRAASARSRAAIVVARP